MPSSSHGIPRTQREMTVHYKNGRTRDIMRIIMRVINRPELQTQIAEFAEKYRAESSTEQYEKLRQMWHWVHDNIPYQEDPQGMQLIKHPARLFWDAKHGKPSDCKSFTVFISMVLQRLGIRHVIRFASYLPNKRIQHVYPVAYLDGKAVIMDAVHDTFDEEVLPYTKIIDKLPQNIETLQAIAGIRNAIGSTDIRTVGRRLVQGLFLYGLVRIIFSE